MAVVGHRGHSRQIMAFHTPASSHNAILAAASTVPYFTPVVSPSDVQPDRPIGYGAFGVVWWVTGKWHCSLIHSPPVLLLVHSLHAHVPSSLACTIVSVSVLWFWNMDCRMYIPYTDKKPPGFHPTCTINVLACPNCQNLNPHPQRSFEATQSLFEQYREKSSQNYTLE